MTRIARRTLRHLAAAALGVAILLAPVTRPLADVDADLFLFTTSVPPNVLILMDNSGSMNHLVWHPAFNPTLTPTCSNWDNNSDYYFTSSTEITRCSNKRWIYHDSTSVGGTRISGRYLNWYFSDAADAYVSDIASTNNGTRACPGATPATYAKYRRNRMTAAKQVVLDTICLVTNAKEVRFGLAVFRTPRDSSGVDPNGGFVEVGVDDFTSTHETALESAVMSENADSWTPLGETLFQLYTFFMGRAAGEQAAPKTSGSFPIYDYSKSTSSGGGAESSSGPPTVPACPVQYECQKNFVIIITDGEPTRDDFDTDPSSTSAGFSSYGNLIGDFNPDSQVEVTGSDEAAWYLDDIAKFMRERDFRPDLPGTQTIDTYTIGYTTEGPANDFLEKTAQQGNGLFFTSSSAEELTAALVKSITDIIEKSQSFTAATVPSTRTASGGDFYTSYFLPSAKSAFWQGHLRAFGIDAGGDLFDAAGNCPLNEPTAGECDSGDFLSSAVPFWDAGTKVPLPGVRKLYTTRLSGTVATRIDFDADTIKAADLGVATFSAAPSPAPNPIYPGSGAKNAEGLADEIASYARGCRFGTGVSGPDVDADLACTANAWRLGDIFHSAPMIIGKPRAAMGDATYAAFAQTYQYRDRIIYFGANDGFLHAVDGGQWNTSASPPDYTRGTGAELFGVMPWEARRNIKNLPIDDPTARHYYVDGSPQAADVWIHPTATTTTKASSGSEWRTYLFGGLRQGGHSYYAIDVTDPTDAGFPAYVWDFPSEADPNTTTDPASARPYLGESWSQPVITKVRVKVGANDNAGKGFERWVMIVGGGYAASGDPNDAGYVASALEGRSINIVDVKTGKLLARQNFAPTAPLGDPRRDMKYAIPSTPAVFDLDFDGYADMLLVGDLGGQVWKWVITAIGEDRVNDGSAAGTYTQPNWPFRKFFEAPTATSGTVTYYKSIYFPPAAAYQGKNLWYGFGTGERNDIRFTGVPLVDENNRMYAIRDADPLDKGPTAPVLLTEALLTDLSSTQSCTTIATPGYYYKLVDGEKMVTNVELFAGYVVGGTFLPANTGNPCTSKGSGKVYVFDVDCGGGYFKDGSGNPVRGKDVGLGMPTDPQVSVGVDGKDNVIFIEKSGADLESIKAPEIPAGAKTMLYWREIQ